MERSKDENNNIYIYTVYIKLTTLTYCFLEIYGSVEWAELMLC